MASSSPFQSNDYSSVSNYRPYVLPVNDIFRGLSAQNQYWEQGAEAVKSAYDNALDLNLTSDEDKQVRDQFIQNAQQQVTKLSTMDLSDPSVQRQGLGIFKPLFQDQAIVQDDYLTKLKSSIFDDANQYKNDPKTQGAGYSDDNLAYSLRNFKNFNANTSRGDMGDVFNQAQGSSYTPYYDTSAEVQSIEKTFKPDSTEYDSPQLDPKTGQPDFYSLSTKDKSVYASQYRAYMDAHLSDKAKQQLHIEGVVKYGDDLNALGNDYTNYNNNLISSQNGAINKLKGTILATKDPTLAKQSQAQIDAYTTDIQQRQGINDSIAKGDYTFLGKNKESIAGQMYANSWLDNLSQASQRYDITKIYKPDAVALDQFNKNIEMKQTEYVQQEEDKRQADKAATDLQLEEWKWEHPADKSKSTTDISTAPTNAVASTADNQNFGQQQVKTMYKDADTQKAAAMDQLKSALKVGGGPGGAAIIPTDKAGNPVISADQQVAAVNQFVTENPNDPDVKRYLATYNTAESGKQAAQAIDDYVEQQYENDPEYKKNINIISNSRAWNPFLRGTVDAYGNPYPDKPTMMINGSPVATFTGYDKPKLPFDGAALKAKYYNEAITKFQGLEHFTDPNQEGLKPLRDNLSAKLTSSLPGIKSDYIQPIYRNKDGDVFVNVETPKGFNQKDINNAMVTNLGASLQPDGTYKIPQLYVNDPNIIPKTYQDPQLDNLQTIVDFRTQGSPNGTFDTPNYKVNNKNFKFRVITENGHPSYQVVHSESGGKFSNIVNGQTQNFNTLAEAALSASQMSKLPDAQFIQLVKTVGGQPSYNPNSQ